jgi:hypothetical protein
MTATELTWFPVTAYLNSAVDGALVSFNATVVFYPRVPRGFTALISDLDLGDDTAGSSALAFPPIPVATVGGVLSYQLLSFSTPISTVFTAATPPMTELIYDVQFTQVTLGFQITNFGFVAPTGTTAVNITDPGLTRLAYGGP